MSDQELHDELKLLLKEAVQDGSNANAERIGEIVIELVSRGYDESRLPAELVKTQ